MGVFRWIAGALGFFLSGGNPFAAIAGYVFGKFLEGGEPESARGNYTQYNTNTGYEHTQREQYYTNQRNSFMFSMLVLISYIIRADGKVMHSEMEYVRRFLSANFGDDAVAEGEEILKRLFEEQKRMEAQQRGSFKSLVVEGCQKMAASMNYSQRLQLLAFLADIVKADGVVRQEEVAALREVAIAMRMNASEVDSLLNLRDSSTSLEAAYKVLGIAPTATDDEVRKAYRQLALKHHPDRVATLGEDVRKAAEKKFQEINAAKDLIFKARGL